jgi:hypothetical protein
MLFDPGRDAACRDLGGRIDRAPYLTICDGPNTIKNEVVGVAMAATLTSGSVVGAWHCVPSAGCQGKLRDETRSASRKIHKTN